jgi:hypothetical protein
MIKSRIFFISLTAITVIAALSNPAHADEQAQAGKAIVQKWQDSVVSVEMVVKSGMSMGSEEIPKRESKNEATGSVIDSSGLVVVSLAATQPDDVLSNLMSQETGGDKFKMTTEVTDVKIRLASGIEIPAKVVLRDKDQDLAFVLPIKTPAVQLPVLDITQSEKPSMLDPIIVLSRLGSVAGRTIGASLERINSVVEKPKNFYIPSGSESGDSLGSPAFSLDGKYLGMIALRSRPTVSADSGNFFGGMSGMGMLYVIIPAADVREAEKQALEAATK